MRLLLLFLLLPYFLAAQAENDYPDKYVWAKSGLTMRNAGNAQGAKMMVVPFGAKVLPTGNIGAQVNVTALAATSYQQGTQTYKSEPYVMYDSYVEVVYQGKTGFVYNGYLSTYSPATKSGYTVDYTEWMEAQFGTPTNVDKQKMLWPHNIDDRQQVSHYPAGVMATSTEYEGGGSMTFIFPSGSINDGYLIAAHFFGITDPVNKKEEFNEDTDFLPELLDVQENGTLQFTGDMSETVIRVIGEMLIISSSGGC
ncbi:MAG: hypothetical protein AB8H12_08745 [Lewinella sp.]